MSKHRSTFPWDFSLLGTRYMEQSLMIADNRDLGSVMGRTFLSLSYFFSRSHTFS